MPTTTPRISAARRVVLAAERTGRERSHWRVNSVYWFSILGLGVWTTLAASGWISGTPLVNVPAFAVVLLVAIVNLFGRSWNARQREQNPQIAPSLWRGTLFVTVDLCLVAAGLRFTGAAQSPLWTMVFLVGVAETMLARPFEADFIRVGTILALYLGTVPSLVHAAPGEFYLEFALRTGIFAAVSIVTRRLRVRQEEHRLEIATLRAELGVAEERARLSREIHDGVGNSLAAGVLRLEFAARKLEKEQPGDESVALLKEEAQALREAMGGVRDWAFFTRPWSHTAGPPSTLLVSEVERLSRRTGLTITVHGADILNDLSDGTRFVILRIAQEALTNAAKHAENATCASVSLRRESGFVQLVITDDGAGFDAASTTAGVGMASMRERAEGAGGTFAVSSAFGQGTTVVAHLPAI